MRKIILVWIISVGQLTAQHAYDYNWVFGFTTDTASILNFNKDTFAINTEYQELKLVFTNGTISNDEGELLFYTNGCEIFDSSFVQMQNGFGLNPGDLADDNCEYGYRNNHQSLIILPSLTNDSIYHLFHQRQIIDPNTEIIYVVDSLYHTIVNMKGNGGKGSVLSKNQPINTTRLNSGNLSAVKKKNGLGWWIIAPLSDSDGYEFYELEEDQIVSVKTQNISEVFLDVENDLQTFISLDGTKYIRVNSDLGAFIFDLDRTLGILSNPVKINIDPDFPSFIGGAAISSNGRFLYINSAIKLWQYDLEAEDIKASQFLVAEYDGFQSPYFTNFWKTQIGPDCKLYYNSSAGVDVLHVMHNPNAKGYACNFEQHGLQLHSQHGRSMPYFPSFRLDTNYPLCDTTKLVATSIAVPLISKKHNWTVAPNPTSGIVNLSNGRIIDPNAKIRLFDISGKLVDISISNSQQNIQLDIFKLPAGIYFYQILDKTGRGHGKILKQ